MLCTYCGSEMHREIRCLHCKRRNKRKLRDVTCLEFLELTLEEKSSSQISVKLQTKLHKNKQESKCRIIQAKMRKA